MAQRPLCFVLMPFGQKSDLSTGGLIDFDEIYENGVRPAVLAAGLDPIRADEERSGGIIHRTMFERLILCDYAIADLTTANANVFYELGVRHAARPSTTLAIFAKGQSLPFDVNLLRALPYSLGHDLTFAAGDAAKLQSDLMAKLLDLKDLARRQTCSDSPVFQLIPQYRQPEIEHLKTDVFRDQAEYATRTKEALAEARHKRDKLALHDIQASLGSIADAEAGVVIDLYLSYRAVSDWQAMVELHDRMAPPLRRMQLVREQLGWAYNRLGQRRRAIEVLEGVLSERGPGSEICGLLGRVEKDMWQESMKSGNRLVAGAHLDRAIELYRMGFEADSRDFYPGINAVTLLDIRGDPASLTERDQLVPVVRFAARQRLKAAHPAYWDYATLLELAVLAEDQRQAAENLGRALAVMRERWEPETTVNNLGLIREARLARGADVAWLDEIVTALRQAAHEERG